MICVSVVVVVVLVIVLLCERRSATRLAPELYSAKEIQLVQDHIDKYFGASSTVFHELISPDLHVDIVIIPPAVGREYYTLITLGMGAHRMHVPPSAAAECSVRAELMLTLPPDWRLDEESLTDARCYWPLRWLKTIARLPGMSRSWLAPAHTLGGETPEPLAPDTELNSFIILSPEVPEEARTLTLPGGDQVSFYQLYPLYPEELEFALRCGAARLLPLIPSHPVPPICPTRPRLRLPQVEEDAM